MSRPRLITIMRRFKAGWSIPELAYVYGVPRDRMESWVRRGCQKWP